MASGGKSYVSAFLVCICMVYGQVSADRSHLPPPCESEIYCHGRLLDTIQMAGIYPDSKTFVDMKMKQPPNETLAAFDVMMATTGDEPTRGDIQAFIEENFDPAGSEFEEWVPRDWKAHPAFLSKIRDPVFRKWASDLNEFWLKLGRKMKHEVKLNQELYSIIYVDNPVIVPGGRFREFYYWDSYWIIKGLLLSEMKSTARGMLLNFISIIERIGHIPNGGRIYYKRRSQPPLLVPMVKTYVDETGDISILRDHIHTLEKEFDYWMNNHFVEVEHDGERYQLARYEDQSQGPRPESYSEDVRTARVFNSVEKQEEYYAELKAAAESGWDFSTRWFITNGTNKGNLTNLKTRSIIPVDLNAFLCWNAELISEFHGRLGNYRKQAVYKDFADRIMEAIEKVLWHEEVGAWLDYDMLNGKHRDYFCPSNIAPLWTNSYNSSRREYYVSHVMKYLDNTKVDHFAGGIPTTFEHSSEQWDYPNAWPPLQHIVIVGLTNTEDPSAQRLASEWASRWVRSNHIAWAATGSMFEKYDATIAGRYGGGGEYQIQAGFGWTNGVIMDFLNLYGDRLSSVDLFLPDDASATVRSDQQPTFGNAEDVEMVRAGGNAGSGSIITAVLAVMATLTAGALGYTVYRKRHEHGPPVFSVEGSRLLKQATERTYTELKNLQGPVSTEKISLTEG